MPLRDHFHPPLDNRRHWEGFHAFWPAKMVERLMGLLPERYFAEPRVHSGGSVEIDTATFHEEAAQPGNGHGDGGVTTDVWAPPRATVDVSTGRPVESEYEVRVFDSRRQCRLVAAVEIVSPANKGRPETRRLFVAKCAALLQSRVSVAMIDLVTTRHFNVYADLLELLNQADATLGPEPPTLHAAALRWTPRADDWRFQTWSHTLTLGQPLPTLPLWLADDLAVPRELEESYEDACRILRIA